MLGCPSPNAWSGAYRNGIAIDWVVYHAIFTAKVSETIELGVEGKIALDTEVFHIILESTAKGTGTKVSDITDDTEIVELGEV